MENYSGIDDMTDLDEVSKSIGRLQEQADSSQRHREKVFDKIDALTVQTTAMVTSVNQLLEVVEKHETKIGLLLAFKNRTLGYVAAIGTSAGALGSYISKMVHHQ